MPSVTFFRPGKNGKNVIEKFLGRELRQHRDVQVQLLDQIRVLALVKTAVLRERGVIEHVSGEILSFRFKAKAAGNIWVRLLIACWPDDNSVIILLPVLKTQNKLDPDDIGQAKKNLRVEKERS